MIAIRRGSAVPCAASQRANIVTSGRSAAPCWHSIIQYAYGETSRWAGPKGSTSTDGLTGVRVNHVLNVHVEGFAVGK